MALTTMLLVLPVQAEDVVHESTLYASTPEDVHTEEDGSIPLTVKIVIDSRNVIDPQQDDRFDSLLEFDGWRPIHDYVIGQATLHNVQHTISSSEEPYEESITTHRYSGDALGSCFYRTAWFE
ncbi:hypothetical protein GF324_08655 [bacterium]|nr:hypothetical protein [bacterium]